jgi:hypothetical protein
MDRDVTLDVLDAEGGRVPWDFCCVKEEDRFRVTARGPGGVERHGVGEGWFDALRALRLALEGDGLRPLCVGSVVNAHQSGMLAGDGDGSVAYLLRRRRSPGLGEVAWIFDPAPAEDTGTVAEQDAFFESWAAEGPRYGPVRAAAGLAREYWHRLRYR